MRQISDQEYYFLVQVMIILVDLTALVRHVVYGPCPALVADRRECAIMKGDAKSAKMRQVFQFVRGVTGSRDNPGYLEMSQERLERILVREPIHVYYEVEQEPFARIYNHNHVPISVVSCFLFSRVVL
ncbi:hypothetical protein AAG570_009875 [Ranatra chinensis]|uniref:Uncharacterized protein n=1 Tax=Ranatra chinensis TaxID=642074 RepID=A0ABD0YQC2_9HEMI